MPIFRTTPSRITVAPVTTTDPRFRHLVYSIVLLSLIFLQVVFVPWLSIAAAVPVLPLILCVMITLREGRLVGIFYGFVAGLLHDFATFQILGADALAMMLAVFAVGYFYAENAVDMNLTRVRFLGMVFLAATIRNVAFSLVAFSTDTVFPLAAMGAYILGGAVYTTVAALFPWLFLTRRT